MRPAPVLFALAVGVGCEAPERHASEFADSGSVADEARVDDAPADTALEPELVAWLAAQRVTDASFARRTLYSWTSAETAARLRRERTLFDDNVMPEGPTAYVQRLEETAARGGTAGRLAELLTGHPDLSRRRYAWPRPWPTRLGLGPRDYGPELIAVTLTPQALVGRFDPDAAQPFAFVDLDGRGVPLGRVLADPGRIGAILHVRRGAPAYREYVLCNEAMVASWSLATPALAELLTADAAALRALAAHRLPEADSGAWNRSGSARDAGELYASVLAFDVPRYRPDAENLEALADTLEASLPNGAALTVAPKRRFDAGAAIAVRRIPPRLFTFVDV